MKAKNKELNEKKKIIKLNRLQSKLQEILLNQNLISAHQIIFQK